METRRYRIDLDLGARLNRLNRDRAFEEAALTHAPASNGGARVMELVDRQERLLEAMAANDHVVDRLLHEWAGFSVETLEDVWDDQGHEIVMSLVPSLDPEDRALFDPAAMGKLFNHDLRLGDLPAGTVPAVYTRLQRALRKSLLRDDDALDAWLRNAAVLELVWSYEESMLPPSTPDREILEPVLPALAPEDRAVYRAALDGDYIWDVAGEALMSAKGWIRAVWVRRIEDVPL